MADWQIPCSLREEKRSCEQRFKKEMMEAEAAEIKKEKEKSRVE